MKKKKVWRYYCDWCKKSGCSGGHMRWHEEHCTNNPNRDCKMCTTTGRDPESIISLIQALRYNGLDGLRERCEGCPACMLAAIRQSKINQDCAAWVEFHYEKEKQSFWAEHNRVGEQ